MFIKGAANLENVSLLGIKKMFFMHITESFFKNTCTYRLILCTEKEITGKEKIKKYFF
jgi:hypothetical protein